MKKNSENNGTSYFLEQVRWRLTQDRAECEVEPF